MRIATIPGFSLEPPSWAGVTSRLEGVEIDLGEVPEEGDFKHVVATMSDELGRAVYAGYSMGGRIALGVAIERPHLVEALVLVSSSPGIKANDERLARLRADAELADWIDEVGVDEFLDRWLSEPLFATVDPEAARRYRIEDPGVIANQLRRLGQGAQPSFWNRLPELDMPVLFIVGADDRKYVDVAERAATAVGSNAEVAVIPDAGHSLLVEAPEAVARRITSFLSSAVG